MATDSQKNKRFKVVKLEQTADYFELSTHQKDFMAKIADWVSTEKNHFYAKHDFTDNFVLHPPLNLGDGKQVCLDLEKFRVKPILCWFPELLFPGEVVCHCCGGNTFSVIKSEPFITRACLGISYAYFAMRQNLRCANPGCSSNNVNTFSEEFLKAQKPHILQAWPGLMDCKKYCVDSELRKYNVKDIKEKS